MPTRHTGSHGTERTTAPDETRAISANTASGSVTCTAATSSLRCPQLRSWPAPPSASSPGRRWAAGPALILALFTGTGLTWAAVFADRLRPDARWRGAAMTSRASVANDVPSGLVWLTVLVAVSGTAVACYSLVRLARLDVDGVDPLSGPRPPSGQGFP